MAITQTHINLLRSLVADAEIPVGVSILEIGEPNFYGEAPPRSMLRKLIDEQPEPERTDWVIELDRAARGMDPSFRMAKLAYRLLFRPREIISIDWGGTTAAIRHDLNLPLNLRQKFGLVVNNGTAEHVFNIANVFRLMHDHCETNGLMIHEAPFRGWDDHGLYSLQPGLFHDVAKANGYKTVTFATQKWEISTGEQVTLFVALRKLVDAPFVIPVQGCYESHRPK